MSILAPAQAARGAEVHVAHIHGGPHLPAFAAPGISLHHISARDNHDPRILSQLWAVMTAVDPDVVHTWLPQMDIAAGLVALGRRLPWVLSERSCATAYYGRFKDRVIRRAVGQWADCVVANSTAGAALWESTLRRRARAHVVRNIIPIRAITSAPAADLEQLGLALGQPAVIFVGRLAPEKNVELLLAVAEEVCRQSKTAFLICGDGPLRESMESRIRASSHRDRLRLLGERDDVWSLIKASRVFISTSAFEGQPNAVLEAMACGCPLVVSDIPAHREFLDERTAQLVPFVRDDFVRAVLHALERGSDIEERAIAARERAGHYDVDSAALAYEMIYEEAARRHR